MAERPSGRDDAPDGTAGSAGASRARTGGSARPVGVPPRPPVRDPRATGAPPVPARPSVVPPSFAPGAGGARPASADDALTVGPPPVPRSAPPRPAAPRVASPPAATPASRPNPGSPVVSLPPAGGARPPSVPRAGSATAYAPTPPAPGATSGAPTLLPPGSGHGGGTRRRVLTAVAVVLVLLLAWPIGLMVWANGKVQHVDVLTSAADTPGVTYLLAGSDSRGGEGGIAQDGTEGARTDTIMLLHVPPSGPAALVSLPRDTLAEIPGQGANKLNAAYSWGGAPLLVETVEGLTGMHVDHYVEIGLGGVAQVVDAVGGVELCLDPAVNQVDFPLDDPDSGLVWDAPGCKVVDGVSSLAFARMRKADREGDIGRAKRQQQLIAALSSSAATPSLAVRPDRQVGLVSAGLGALQVSEDTGIVDLGRLALAFRSATGPEGIRGTPPIIDADYRPGGIGSTVRLDPDATPGFFRDVMNGDLPPGPVGGVPAA